MLRLSHRPDRLVDRPLVVCVMRCLFSTQFGSAHRSKRSLAPGPPEPLEGDSSNSEIQAHESIQKTVSTTLPHKLSYFQKSLKQQVLQELKDSNETGGNVPKTMTLNEIVKAAKTLRDGALVSVSRSTLQPR